VNDLLDDLQAERRAPGPAVPLPPDASTPALTLRWTPLRWSRPRLAVPERGGVALAAGPLRVEVSRA
jgi:hypothetical protein